MGKKNATKKHSLINLIRSRWMIGASLFILILAIFGVYDVFSGNFGYRQAINRCGGEPMVGHVVSADGLDRLYERPTDDIYMRLSTLNAYFCSDDEAQSAGYKPRYAPDGTTVINH